MIGSARGAYALGDVDDTRDPIGVLRPESAVDGFGALSRAREQLSGQAG